MLWQSGLYRFVGCTRWSTAFTCRSVLWRIWTLHHKLVPYHWNSKLLLAKCIVSDLKRIVLDFPLIACKRTPTNDPTTLNCWSTSLSSRIAMLTLRLSSTKYSLSSPNRTHHRRPSFKSRCHPGSFNLPRIVVWRHFRREEVGRILLRNHVQHCMK